MFFIDRLEAVLAEKKVTKTELAEVLKIRRPTLSEWKKNGVIPPADIMLKIAEYLNVSVEWLVTGKEKEKDAISQEETKVLEYYKQLSQEQKEMVLTLLETQTKKMAAGGDRL